MSEVIYPRVVFDSVDFRVVQTGASAEDLIVERPNGCTAMNELNWTSDYSRDPDLLEGHLKQALLGLLTKEQP